MGTNHRIINDDCITELAYNHSGASYDLIVADPPFNIGVDYDKYDDSLQDEQYLEFTKNWIGNCIRVLKSTGSMWICIGPKYVSEVDVTAKKYGLIKRNHCIWHYTFGVNCQNKFTPSSTHLLYYTCSDKFTFNADAIRVPSARQIKYKDKRANPIGRIPDDVWDFPRICGTFKERVKWHPTQMNLLVVERIIAVSSNKADIVLDPFAGAFTTAVACKKLKRNSVNIEISEEYCTHGKERLEKNFTIS